MNLSTKYIVSSLRPSYSQYIVLFALLVLSCLSQAGGANSSDFIIKDAQGNSTQALSLSAKVDIEINGLITHTKIKQRFLNSSSDFVAGEYVFPLPDTASVDSLTIKIGSRVIQGEIKEKQQAKKIFKQAQAAGKKAALLTQDRPNMFRMAVTNIPPGEIIEINMTYVNHVEFDNGEYRLMFPMTLTPRFNPAVTSSPIDAAKNFIANPEFMLNRPKDGDIKNPLELNIKLNPGFLAKNISSSSHAINVIDREGHQKNISFVQRFEPMDSDFHLTWNQNNPNLQPSLFVETIYPEAPSTSDAEVSAHKIDTPEHYAMLMLTPSAADYEQTILNKEVIFIIDTSGSMGGESMRQAKTALMEAVQLLNQGDSFNIIEFNSVYSSLFSNTRDFNAENKSSAENFIQSLKAGGGTQMKPALLQALQSPVDEEERLRQVVFITDGAVGNEQELLQSINLFLGDARLFSVAIGSAPNQHLFRQVSKVGKGTFVQIHQLNQVTDQMKKMFNKISKPAMKNIALVDGRGSIISIEPESIPDVYYGEPVKVALRLSDLQGGISIKGTIAGREFEEKLSLQQHNSQGVAKLWAKAKIETITDKMTLRQGDQQQLINDIIALSIKHNILTPYTSFIAVDKEVSRKPGQALKQSNVKNLIPKGTQYPRSSLDIQPLYVLSLMFALLGMLLRPGRRA